MAPVAKPGSISGTGVPAHAEVEIALKSSAIPIALVVSARPFESKFREFNVIVNTSCEWKSPDKSRPRSNMLDSLAS
jgi:hypothetical protein